MSNFEIPFNLGDTIAYKIVIPKPEPGGFSFGAITVEEAEVVGIKVTHDYETITHSNLIDQTRQHFYRGSTVILTLKYKEVDFLKTHYHTIDVPIHDLETLHNIKVIRRCKPIEQEKPKEKKSFYYRKLLLWRKKPIPNKEDHDA